jgi:hypothetical protein
VVVVKEVEIRRGGRGEMLLVEVEEEAARDGDMGKGRHGVVDISLVGEWCLQFV